MVMPKNLKSLAGSVAVVALGVFVAGLAMNVLRDNALVKQAVNGFDA